MSELQYGGKFNITDICQPYPWKRSVEPDKVSAEQPLKVETEAYLLGDHTETVQIEFDPNQDQLREAAQEVLRQTHDSTQPAKIPVHVSHIGSYHDENSMNLPKWDRNIRSYHQKYMLRQNRSLFQSLIFKPNEEVTSYTAARLNGYMGGFGKLTDFEAELESLGLSDEQEQYARSKIKGGGLN
eukprot:XP_011663317.1 PREDICTED: peptide methionine sulfoxide reductase-like [Strongylocentrotus purpuratus]